VRNNTASNGRGVESWVPSCSHGVLARSLQPEATPLNCQLSTINLPCEKRVLPFSTCVNRENLWVKIAD
jgi:hypothetical protein